MTEARPCPDSNKGQLQSEIRAKWFTWKANADAEGDERQNSRDRCQGQEKKDNARKSYLSDEKQNHIQHQRNHVPSPPKIQLSHRVTRQKGGKHAQRERRDSGDEAEVKAEEAGRRQAEGERRNSVLVAELGR
jgi:hypothetical protein